MKVAEVLSYAFFLLNKTKNEKSTVICLQNFGGCCSIGYTRSLEGLFFKSEQWKILNTLPLSWQICLAVILVGFLSSCNCQEAAVLLIKHYCS